MALDEYDEIISEMLTEMTDLLFAGLDDQRKGNEFSDEERFITLSKRVAEMARSRPDTTPIKREGFRQPISMRDVVFRERKERHDKEKAQKKGR